MRKSVDVRLLTGKHRAVSVDEHEVLAMKDNSAAVVGMEALASQVAALHGRPRAPDHAAQYCVERVFHLPPEWPELIPRRIYRDADGMAFLEATNSFGLPSRAFPAQCIYLEIPRDMLGGYLSRYGFDDATQKTWTGTSAVEPVTNKQAKKRRNQNLTRNCLDEIEGAFREDWLHPPSYKYLRQKFGCKSDSPAREAWRLFYAKHPDQKSKWGPGPPHGRR